MSYVLRQPYGFLVLIVLFQMILYFSAICFTDQSVGFVFDDYFLVVQSYEKLQLSEIWFQDLWASDHSNSGFYRPVFVSSIWIDQHLFGLHAFGYRLHNVIWYILCTWILVLLLSQYHRSYAWLATLLITLHPMLSEGVCWIAARNDMQCVFFIVLSMYWYTLFGYKDDKNQFVYKQYLWSLPCVLGLLSKETAISLVCVLLISFCSKKQWKQLIVLLCLLVGWWWWRIALGIHTPSLSMDILQDGMEYGFLIAVDVGSRLVVPWRLSPATGFHWLEVVWWQVGLCVINISLFVWGWRRIFGASQKEYTWLYMAIISALLPFPSILYTGVYGDRYWILSIVALGIFCLQHIPANTLSRHQTWSWVIIVVWSGIIWNRVPHWNSDTEFWEQEERQFSTPYSQVSLAHMYYNQKRYGEAMRLYYQSYVHEIPYLYGCASFLDAVLKTEGSQSMQTAYLWVTQKGCPVNGEMKGLLAVSYVQTAMWTELQTLLQEDIKDPTKRLDLAYMAWDVYQQDLEHFCELYAQWQQQNTLRPQLNTITQSTMSQEIDVAIEVCLR
jgi:hypothetical protein